MALTVAASGCSKNSEDGQESPVNKIQGETALPEATWQDATLLLSPFERQMFAQVNKNMGFELTARSSIKTVLTRFSGPVQKIIQEELQIIETNTRKVIATSQFERIPLISCDWPYGIVNNLLAESDWVDGLFVNGKLIGIAQNERPKDRVTGVLCEDALIGEKLCKGHPNKNPVKFVSCTVKKGADDKVIHFSE
jgi:hypothetical protein